MNKSCRCREGEVVDKVQSEERNREKRNNNKKQRMGTPNNSLETEALIISLLTDIHIHIFGLPVDQQSFVRHLFYSGNMIEAGTIISTFRHQWTGARQTKYIFLNNQGIATPQYLYIKSLGILQGAISQKQKLIELTQGIHSQIIFLHFSFY